MSGEIIETVHTRVYRDVHARVRVAAAEDGVSITEKTNALLTAALKARGADKKHRRAK